MSHRDYDRWLWLGLGASLFVTIKTLRYLHTETARLSSLTAQPPPPSPTPPRVPSHNTTGTQAQEDAIPLSSLATLALRSPSYEIRIAATHIICDRFMRTPAAVDLLRTDLGSEDIETVDAARLAGQFLHDMGHFDGVDVVAMDAQQHGQPTVPRMREESDEEIRLRRRRREAMVLAETGAGPVTQENIIQGGAGLLSPEPRGEDEGNESFILELSL